MAALRANTTTMADSLVLEAALEALSVYCAYAPLPLLLRQGDLLSPLCFLLHSQAHRLDAVSALLQLAERKGAKVGDGFRRVF